MRLSSVTDTEVCLFHGNVAAAVHGTHDIAGATVEDNTLWQGPRSRKTVGDGGIGD
jgi:hypothetical protein